MMKGDMKMMREYIYRGNGGRTFHDQDETASSETYKAGDVVGCAID
jgi:hypothetical protein